MRIVELVGFILTYEITLPNSKKPKDYAFKASENDEKYTKISYNIARDEVAHMTKRIKKVIKFNKFFFSKIKNKEKKKT